MLLRAAVFFAGLVVVLLTLASAVRTFVLPRSARDTLARSVFSITRRIFRVFLAGARAFQVRDRLLAFYAPVSVLLLLPVWLGLVLVGYTAMFWAVSPDSIREAFYISGSSLLTLGFIPAKNMGEMLLAFSEATIGLLLVALLIAYLPTMYSAFSRREVEVARLEVRAGSPPSAEELFARYFRLDRLDQLGEIWSNWENWFAELEETHTSLTPLVFFRSPRPERSWVTAAGAVLDAASLAASALDLPRDPRQDLCIRAGYLALRQIADFFGIRYHLSPDHTHPIHVTRQEFDETLDRLSEIGVPIKADRDQAWRDFRGWRVNYDSVLLDLAALVSAPPAPWSSDRMEDRPRSWFYNALH